MTAIDQRFEPLGHEVRFAFLLGCGFFVLLSFPGVGGLPSGMTGAHALMFASLPFWFAASVRRRALVLDQTAALGAGLILVCLAFLVGWAFLSAMVSNTPLRTGRPIVALLSGISCFFLVTGTVTHRRLNVFVDVLCLTLALTCLISVAAFYLPPLQNAVFNGTDRASGYFKNPNQFGMAISVILPVAVACLLGQRERRLLWLGCLAALLLGLVLSGSKTNLMISSATLIFVLGAFSMIAQTGMKRVRMLVLSFLVTAALPLLNIALLWIYNPRALSLFTVLLSEQEELHSLTTRSEIWRRSIEEFLHSPVFGQGAGHPIDIFYADQLVTHSHNVLLDYLRTMGAPGFFGFLIVVLAVLFLSLSSIRLAFKMRQAELENRILCIGLSVAPIAYLTANMSSDSMGPSTSPFLWVTFFLALAARVSLLGEPRPR